MNRDEIIMAYRLILGREPKVSEVDAAEKRGLGAQTMRQHFLFSKEFSRKYTAMIRARAARLPRTVIHIHIPKTAGTSLNSVLGQNFPPSSRLAISSVTLDLLDDIPPLRRQSLKALHGHIQYGLADKLVQDCLYICVLRRPGPRVFSFFKFIGRSETHPLNDAVGKSGMSFGAFLEYAADHPAARGEIDNGQIRRLAGPPAHGESSTINEVFRRAIAHAFAPDMMFGLTEEFDNFLQRLVGAGVISTYDPVYHNVSPKGSDYDDAVKVLTQKQKDLLNEFTRWDNLFYDICKKYLLAPNLEVEQIT